MEIEIEVPEDVAAQLAAEIIWRDFGYENDYEEVVRTEGFENLGPFVFSSMGRNTRRS